MNRILIIASIFCTLFALLSVIWIILPAPSYYIWLYSVAVSEWSLWFGAIALLGILSAIGICVIYKPNIFAVSSLVFGAIAFLISLYPFFGSIKTAQEKNVSLSFTQYFAGLNATEAARQFTTEVFKNDGKAELKMDVYRPLANVVGNGAGIVVVHGGSWSGGVRNDFPQWNQWFADNGLTVFDIDYSLTQPNYSSAIGDVKSAVVEIKKRSAEFNISPDKIILLGRSAGGHLALITAYSAANSDESVAAVISVYAPTDLLWDYDNLSNEYVIDGRGTLSNLLGGNPYQSDEIRKRYLQTSPIENVSAETPPTLLIHGGKDQLVRLENMNRLARKLNEFKVRNETLDIPYGQHGFDYNFNGWGSQITKAVILNFLNNNAKNRTQ
jgi:acetyl esterase/lipase